MIAWTIPPNPVTAFFAEIADSILDWYYPRNVNLLRAAELFDQFSWCGFEEQSDDEKVWFFKDESLGNYILMTDGRQYATRVEDGWIETDPLTFLSMTGEFNRANLYAYQAWGTDTIIAKNRDHTLIAAAAATFDITLDHAAWVFLPEKYDPAMTPARIATRLRDLANRYGR